MAYNVDNLPEPPEKNNIEIYYEWEDGLLVRKVVTLDEEDDES